MATKSATDCCDVLVEAGDAGLAGVLSVPSNPNALVVFSHGSGSARLSARNAQLTQRFNGAGLATLLFELLTPEEYTTDQETRIHRFDIPLLAERLTATVDWLPAVDGVGTLPVGLYGVGTGAAAALITATRRPERIGAVVVGSGRPDLAGDRLARVRTPTLLIAGSKDGPVVEMNREASNHLYCLMRLEIIPGATHFFDEPGSLDTASQLATEWFLGYLLDEHPWRP